MLLGQKGISVDPRDQQKMTPLHIAALYSQVEVAEILIKNGADIGSRDENSGTPFQYAAYEGSLDMVKLMLNRYSEYTKRFNDILNDQDNDGSTALHLAVVRGHLSVAEHVVKILFKYNRIALNATNNYNETPLHLAARHGHLNIVKLLTNNKVKIDPRDENWSTPLILASQYNHHEVVQHLAEKKADIELYDSDQFTALLIAANYGHTETIAVLLGKGANVMAVDKNDKSVLFQCAEEGRTNVLECLLKKKEICTNLLEYSDRFDNTPLHVAAQMGHYQVVKILLEAGAVIDAKNEDEQTPLHLAAENGRVKIVQELVRKKPSVINNDDENANTPLHLAALRGKIHVVRELVGLGANIEARNAKQWTPLSCCAFAGMHKSAQVLLEADCSVVPKDKRDYTPLHLACREGHKMIVKILLKWKADVTHRAVDGRNALDFAIDFGHASCARVILEDEKWREAMKNRTKDLVTDKLINTPITKLIVRMPDVAEEVFTKCMKEEGKSDSDDYKIAFNYEFLDDNLSLLSSEALQGDESFRSKLPSEKLAVLKKNHPLYVMVRSKRGKLLRHPLVVSLLNHKWRAYGRAVYIINLFTYLLFLGIFNSYMLTMPPPYSIDTVNVTSSCVAIISQAQPNYGKCYDYDAWGDYARIIILVLVGIRLLIEI